MSTLQWTGLLLLAAFAGAVVPFQSAINSNLARWLGHPLWATLASLLVSVLVLLPVILALRLPLPSLGFISKAPLWVWAGGAFGVCFVALAVMLLPRAKAAPPRPTPTKAMMSAYSAADAPLSSVRKRRIVR